MLSQPEASARDDFKGPSLTFRVAIGSFFHLQSSPIAVSHFSFNDGRVATSCGNRSGGFTELPKQIPKFFRVESGLPTAAAPCQLDWQERKFDS